MPNPGWLNSWLKVNSKHVSYQAGGDPTNGKNKDHAGTVVTATSGTTASGSRTRRSNSSPLIAGTSSSNEGNSSGKLFGRPRTNKSTEKPTKSQAKNVSESQLPRIQQDLTSTNQEGIRAKQARRKRQELGQTGAVASVEFVNEKASMHQVGQAETTHQPCNFSCDVAAPTTSGRSFDDQGSGASDSSDLTGPGSSLRSSDVPRRLRHTSGKRPARKGTAKSSAGSGALKLFNPFFSGRKDVDRCIHADDPEVCARCEELEAKLEATLKDLEYQRMLNLQRDQQVLAARPTQMLSGGTDGLLTTVERSTDLSLLKACAPSNGMSPVISLKEASKQLSEVTAVNRNHVEHLAKERSSFQQDMQSKLSKLEAELAECRQRSSTMSALEEELRGVKEQRDDMAEELARLRAQVSRYEKQEKEFHSMKQRIEQYEEEGLRGAEEAINGRNQIIEDLCSKLEQVTEELEVEKAQRLRRQVIFPQGLS